ncbi:MAG: hypothetical protein JSR36_07545 [Proteobacteria bacterium]|nr:hypothetical protein [Pseudomonadota bacterium]
MSRVIATLTCVVAALAIQSCKTQSTGDTKSADPKAIAMIVADSPFNAHPSLVVVIEEVDGARVTATTYEVAVSPGPHKLIVMCESREGGGSNVHSLDIDAVAGARYHLDVKVGGDTKPPCEAVAKRQ